MIEFPCPNCRQPRAGLEAACASCGWQPRPVTECEEQSLPLAGDAPASPFFMWCFLVASANLSLSVSVANVPLLIGALSGFAVGQHGVLVVWAALGPERFVVRMSVCMLLSCLLYTLTLVGTLMASSAPTAVLLSMLRTVLLVPSFFLSAQVSCWLVRLLLGFQIVYQPQGYAAPVHAPGGQLSIRTLMWSTACIGIALGMARYVFSGIRSEEDHLPLWLMLLGSCGVFVAWGVFALLPAVYVSLKAELGMGATLMCAYVYILILAPTTWSAVQGGPILSLAVFTAGLTLGHFGILFGSLLAARLCGFRLARKG